MEKQVLDKVLRQLHTGTLEVAYWDGEKRRYGHGAPQASISIKTPKVLRRALRSPSVALGEAYLNGDLDVEEPFQNLLRLAVLNPLNLQFGSARRLRRQLHPNKKAKQQSYISQHYDIGNDFYKLWLDPTLSYSCAYFHRKSDSLEQAQRQKIDHILKKLQLKKGMRLLDIGSGWGYLLIAAAKRYGAHGTGVSLSHEQVTFARQLATQEGVADLVSFRLLNYQDLPQSPRYDRIVSVGFFEHVGAGNLPVYFKQLERLLKPGGISVLHSITHQDEAPSDPWIDKYIFPGGYIPSVRETTALLPEYGLYLFDYENLGQHYALTLEHWWRNYERHKTAVIKMYDERFYRMWRLYLIAAMTAFNTGSAHLSQWTFKQGPDPIWPLTREYLYR